VRQTLPSVPTEFSVRVAMPEPRPALRRHSLGEAPPSLQQSPTCTNPQRAYFNMSSFVVHFNGIFSDTLQLVIVARS